LYARILIADRTVGCPVVIWLIPPKTAVTVAAIHQSC
jgi:hypothetical protein